MHFILIYLQIKFGAKPTLEDRVGLTAIHRASQVIYVYIYICIYIYIHICIHIDIYIHTHIKIHISIFIYTHVRTHIHVHIYIHIYTYRVGQTAIHRASQIIYVHV